MASDVLGRFVSMAPFAVMTRMLARDFLGEQMNTIFEAHRELQYDSLASFEAVAQAVADVVLNFSDNFNQAYHKHKEKLAVTRQAFYAKTRGVDAAVSEAVVSCSAERAAELQDALKLVPWEPLPGYSCYSVDGNSLAKTDKRLGVLHDVKGAPLPGKIVARYDLQRQLFDRAYVLLDGHAQESTCCDRIVADVCPRDVLIADRHFCIVAFLERIAQATAFFVVRQHGRLKGVLVGERRQIGRIDTGVVFEQAMRLSTAEDALQVRRITVQLDAPTRDGDTEIHVLTNLPKEVRATTIAGLYRHRWQEETAFHVLQMTLTCEHPGVGHPRAATFLFCLSLLAFNLRQTLFAALYATQDEQEVDNISHFHISKNVSDNTQGMLIAINPEEWDNLIPQATTELAKELRRIAAHIELSQYRKATRGPKQKMPHRSRNVPSSHLSTAKLLGIT